MEKIKYPNIEISQEGIDQYNDYQKSIQDVFAEREKRLKEAKESLKNIEIEEQKLGNRVKSFFRMNYKLKNQIIGARQKIRELDNNNLEHLSDIMNMDYKNYVEVSNDAKLYAFTKKYEDTVKQLNNEGTIDQEQIDLVMQQAKKSIETNPLMVTNVNNTIPQQGNYHPKDPDWNLEYAQAVAAKINEQKYNNNGNKVKHASLTKLFKTHLRGYGETVKTVTSCDVSRDAGCLPPEWIALLPKDRIAEKTKEISKYFQDFANRTCSPKGTELYLIRPYMEELQGKLSAALGTKIEIDFLGNGEIGKAFKIQTDDKKLVIKTNHSSSSFIRNDSNATHGNTPEIASGIHVSNSDDKKKYAKTYMGRVGNIQDRDTFIISRFIESKKNPKKDKSSIERLSVSRVENNDAHEGNVVNGKIIDMGATYISKTLEDRETQKFVKRIIEALPRRDGIEIYNQLKESTKSNPKLQEKLKNALRYVDKELKNQMPDIDHTGLRQRPLRKEVMDAMGISNMVSLSDALRCVGQDNTNIIKDIVEKRGGMDKVIDQIKNNPNMTIDINGAKALIQNGAKPEDFVNNYMYSPNRDDGYYYNILKQAQKDYAQNNNEAAEKPADRENIGNRLAAMGTKLGTRTLKPLAETLKPVETLKPIEAEKVQIETLKPVETLRPAMAAEKIVAKKLPTNAQINKNNHDR